ncbi:hypothetical protein IWW38_003578 [Coemansia aciculifera]|uniref:Uncharacterized protein n=1 Tax=Coemansia aciculifera TaxID=417176 RepID=A0ACC1M1C9_9FUNG|nr:hypothetical protein IWW38_003578 [Coemansia aciculifera]
MRRAHHQSWTDSMASSITLSGSMSAAGRAPPTGSRLARPGAHTTNPLALRRLVHELNASRIDEESNEEEEEFDDEGERTGMTAEAEHPDRMHPRLMSPLDRSARHPQREAMLRASVFDDEPEDGSLAQSRGLKAARTVKRKTRRLLYLISYYISRFIHELGSTTAVTYRPVQFGIY